MKINNFTRKAFCLKIKLPAQSAKKELQNINITTNKLKDFLTISNIISDNYRVYKTSQIFFNRQNNKYMGYLQLSKNINKNAIENVCHHIRNDIPDSELAVSLENTLKTNDENINRYSVINGNKNLSTILSFKLYEGGDSFGERGARFDDYGYMLDKVDLITYS